jgi:hypothetical protein
MMNMIMLGVIEEADISICMTIQCPIENETEYLRGIRIDHDEHVLSIELSLKDTSFCAMIDASRFTAEYHSAVNEKESI